MHASSLGLLSIMLRTRVQKRCRVSLTAGQTHTTLAILLFLLATSSTTSLLLALPLLQKLPNSAALTGVLLPRRGRNRPTLKGCVAPLSPMSSSIFCFCDLFGFPVVLRLSASIRVDSSRRTPLVTGGCWFPFVEVENPISFFFFFFFFWVSEPQMKPLPNFSMRYGDTHSLSVLTSNARR
jgi:hypothetical protein